jgi:hypothetical protein
MIKMLSINRYLALIRYHPGGPSSVALWTHLTTGKAGGLML